MRVIVQRVAQASVSVVEAPGAPATPVSAIGHGLMCLVGIGTDDTEADMDWVTKKILALRLFDSVPKPAAAAAAAPAAAKPVEGATTLEVAPEPAADAPKPKAWAANVTDVGGSVLMVSQFTLCHVLKGNKPDFHNAMKGDLAKPMFDKMVANMAAAYKPECIATGAFGAHMHVALVNDGPVTITLDSKNKN